jgi:hypothetical protein
MTEDLDTVEWAKQTLKSGYLPIHISMENKWMLYISVVQENCLPKTYSFCIFFFNKSF